MLILLSVREKLPSWAISPSRKTSFAERLPPLKGLAVLVIDLMLVNNLPELVMLNLVEGLTVSIDLADCRQQREENIIRREEMS